jgi:hypothetical protein
MNERDRRCSSGVLRSRASYARTRHARSFGPALRGRRLERSVVFRTLAAAGTTCTRGEIAGQHREEEMGVEKYSRAGTYLRHSSTIRRCVLRLMERIIHRSWLKLLRMTDMPLPSLPSVLDSGTRTLSNVTNAVPAVAEYAVLIGLVESSSERGTRMTVYPPSVLQPTVK